MNNEHKLPIAGIVTIIATIVMIIATIVMIIATIVMTIAGIVTIIAINQELYLEKACRVNFNHSEAICARIGIL